MALPDNRAIDPAKFPAKVRRFVEPDAPAQMQMMLARGMVPLKPLVQVCALYQLWVTGDAPLRAAAEQSLAKLPVGTVRQVAAERLLPVVLDWIALQFKNNLRIVRTILSNAQTDGDTFLSLAQGADESLCEALANNQARLLSTPGLIEALYLNRNLRASTADRIVDFGVRNDVDLSSLPCYEEVVAALKGTAPLSAEEAQAQDEAFRAVQEVTADLSDDDAQREGEALARAQPQPEEEEPSKKSAAGRIRDLNIAQKVRLATIGSKGERAILIRDSNKMVSRAVIRSPAISDSEALAYAGIKSLPDEVVKFMAANKKWIRHYQMKKALIMNPKCPTAEAIRFLRHMRAGDLKAIARSRGLPGPVSKAAKQMIKSRLS
jgi:hypothetical protein